VKLVVCTDQISRDVDTACEQVTSWGSRAVELRFVGSGPIGSDLSPHFLDDLCESLWHWDVRVGAIAPQAFKLGIDQPAMRYHRSILLPASLHLAVLLKAPLVQIGAPKRPLLAEHGCPDDVLEVLAEAAELADNLGLKLGLENELGSWAETGTEAAAIVQAVGHRALGVTWDPAVSLMAGEPSFPVAYQAVRPHLLSVRLRDVTPYGEHYVESLPGDGRCMVGEILAELLAEGFDGALLLDPRLSPRLEGARAAYETIERMIQSFAQVAEC
jgi:sugar phosphate isomerase/epimerase